MKEKVYKELKRLYPNAISFGYYKTNHGTIYFVDNGEGKKEDITDIYKELCLDVACDILLDIFNKSC